MDNVPITAGAGTTIATDDVGGIQYQRVKLAIGADGVATDLPVNDCDSGAGTDNRPGVAIVVPAAGGAAVVPGDATNGLKVQVAAALPAGAALLGKVGIDQTTPGTTNKVSIGTDGTVAVNAALPAGTNNIGDVDIVTVPADPYGTNADVAVAAGAAGSIQAKLRRATQGLEDLKTLIVLAAGANAIGKLAANTGVDIGDVDVTSVVPGTAATNLGKAEDAAHTTGDVGVMPLAVRNDTGAVLATTDGDYIPLATDAQGLLRMTQQHPTEWVTFHDEIGAVTDHAIQAAPAAGLSLYVTDIIILNDATAAITVKLEEDTVTAKTQKTGTFRLPASGGIVMNFRTPIKLTAAKDLGMTTTGVSNFTVEAHGYTAP